MNAGRFGPVITQIRGDDRSFQVIAGFAGESQAAFADVDTDGLLIVNPAFEYGFRQRILDQLLDDPLQRACAIGGIIPLAGQVTRVPRR